jgi:magnesium transporter
LESQWNKEDQIVEVQPIVSNLLDSRTSLLDDELNEKLERAFHKQTSQVFLHNVAKIASEHDPIDLAYAVTRLPSQARAVVYENLPDQHAKIIFMINTGSSTRTAIFREIDDEEIKKLVEHMPPDEAVSMLDDLTNKRLKRILELLEPKKAQRIRELQAHDRHSAGRIMTNEYFSFNLNTTIGEVSTHIRSHPGIELTRRIFVLNNDNELIGYVPARNLIVNPPDLPIRQVMRPILHTVTSDTSRDEVVDTVVRYKDPALPVVDPLTHHILGVITYEDVVEAMEDIADDTIATFAGTAEDVSEREPNFKRFLWRAPWLIVTLFAGLISSTAMHTLADKVWFAILPFFVPLITGMSGNVGLQCSTILVRGISTGEFSKRSVNEAIRRELGIGLMIATVFGLFCGIIVFFLMGFVHHTLENPIRIAITIAFGLFGACMTATSLGSFLPFFFARCRIDPAIASGPIVTAFNDVLSTMIFFLVSWIVYSLLL